MKRISPPLSSAHRLLQCYHSQWEIGDAAIPPQPLENLHQQFRVTSCCDVGHSGRENLHQFLPIQLWRHALSIVVLWICGWYQHVIEMRFWLYLSSHSVSKIRTEGRNFEFTFCGRQFIKKVQSRTINFIDQLNLVYASTIHREKKLSHFDLKSWFTGGTKIRPGKVGNWRIFESI